MIPSWAAPVWCAGLCLLSACGDDGGASSMGTAGGTATTTDAAPTASSLTDAGSTETSGSSSTGTAPGWVEGLAVDETVGAFLSVWGPSDDQIYIVGGQEPAMPGPSVGALYRYDGSAFTAAELPPDTYGLNWIYGVGDDRFAVGDFGTVLHRVGDDDGVAWEAQSCETNLPLWGVWGAAADDVWAVGGDGFMRPPVLCHYDGTAWEEASLPPLTVMSRALFKVWGTAADDVWAVGHRGLILHYDGAEWTEQASGTEADLISLWGTGPDEILSAGGRSDAVLVRYDGAQWQAMPMPGAPGLNGIWMGDDGVATIVGSMGRVDTVAAGSLEATPDERVTDLALHAVFSTGSGRMFAVGGSLDLSPPFTGVVLVR